MHLSCPLYMLNASPISFFFFCYPNNVLMRNTGHIAPRHVVFSPPPLPPTENIMITVFGLFYRYLYAPGTCYFTPKEERRLRALGKVFGPKEKRVIGDWRRVLNEEHHELYSSPKNTGGIQSRRMRWEGHVECKGRGEAHRGFRWGNLKERDYLEELGVHGKLLFKWILKTYNGQGCTRLIWSRVGSSGGLL